MKADISAILSGLTLILLAFTQYVIYEDGGWNPGLIGAAGLVTVMMIRHLRGSR